MTLRSKLRFAVARHIALDPAVVGDLACVGVSGHGLGDGQLFRRCWSPAPCRTARSSGRRRASPCWCRWPEAHDARAFAARVRATIGSWAASADSPKEIHPAALSSATGFQPTLVFSGTVIVPPFEAVIDMVGSPCREAIDGSTPDCMTSKDLTTRPPMTTLTVLLTCRKLRRWPRR